MWEKNQSNIVTVRIINAVVILIGDNKGKEIVAFGFSFRYVSTCNEYVFYSG
ncbi:hypothetical protein [Vibrio nitrifigilis]|uniref:Uncharacterized protein n=1 Tax=Vibrio nitrifigilis TaxID=2789781 RepID=A0ABS0GD35_9VIBR|nr:hypothetical protein [Vibrio nitrifigilis]MBF9000328.1 hypothetical protein [Vibrio nitrifigilis]